MEFANLFKRCPGLAAWIDELAFILTDIAIGGRLLAWWILSTACDANKGFEHKNDCKSDTWANSKKLFGLAPDQNECPDQHRFRGQAVEHLE